ncbi:MAG: HD domain-containing protein [Candidatus Hydrogenedens sp.]|nr:HD domain-containing protein [Candidatus Hydrogenedens sp.]
MERVAIEALKIGKKADKDMFDASGRLLLAGDRPLTRTMRINLDASGCRHVYLGTWDASAVALMEVAARDYRHMGTAVMERLEQQIARDLADAQLDVAPSGSPFSGALDAGIRTNRTSAQVAEAETAYRESLDSTSELISGALPDEEMLPAAERVVAQVMRQLRADACLLFNLMRLRSRAHYLYQHSLNTAALSMSIAAAMGYGEPQVEQVGLSALLKDIGMRSAPHELVVATRKLTASEHVDIQKHTIAGLDALQKLRGLPFLVRFVVYQHHERADGKGYPRRRRKNATHAFARIVAVADAYDSLVTERPWRKALHPYRAMEFLLHQSERAFENTALRGLLRYQSLFPVGSLMELESGEVVRVIAPNTTNYHRPVVFVMRSVPHGKLDMHQIVDLSTEEGLRFRGPHFEPDTNTGDDTPEFAPRLCPSLVIA